jgi:hypothetical protein
MDSDLERLADAYFIYQESQTNDNFHHWNAVTNIIMDGGGRAVDLVLCLVSKAKSPAALAFVGAGPLEDLLVKHGPAVWGEIKAAARRQPQLRKALGHVWGHNRIDSQVRAELRRLCSGGV